MSTTLISERLARLETENQQLKKEMEETNRKLDELLTLKHKGMGAFWLVALIAGSGIAGWISTVVEWFRG